MKKKILTALSFIAAGILLITIGYILGGNINKHDFLHYSSTSDTTENKIFLSDKATVKNLFVNVDTGLIRVIPHDKTIFSYTITNNNESDATVWMDGSVLKVTTEHNKKWCDTLPFFKFSKMDTPKITVFIPRNTVFETVNITIGTAQSSFEGFTVEKKCILHTGVGKTTVRQITAANVTIKTSIGENIFENCAFTNSVIETGIGETVFKGILHGSSVIQSGIGETTLKIHDMRDDYDLSIQSGIGEVYINNHKTSHWITRLSDNTRSDKKHRMKIKNGIGTVRLHFL